MGGFDAERVGSFDPTAMGGFDAEKFKNFDPEAMAGFDASQIGNFDPEAMAGFDAEKFKNFDPTAMAGFDPKQVEHFDPEAMAGFGRDHMTKMDVGSLAAFDVDQVQNLEEVAKEGIGDAVSEFGDFAIEVRKEFLDKEALRLGGVGSFEDLAAKFGERPPSPEELAELGWDKAFDGIEFEPVDGSDIPEGIQDEAMQKALEAFSGTPPTN
jgi:hypothetical protein